MPECDPSQCVLPACYCSADGTLAPGVTEDGSGLDIKQVTHDKTQVLETIYNYVKVPQMIMISFNGAVTGENMDMYAALFKSGRVNPNGCSVKGTFFVSHKYTNYSAVTELHRQGHEVDIKRIK